jgi:hypothetical protein
MAKKIVSYLIDSNTLKTPAYIENGGLVPNNYNLPWPQNIICVGRTIDNPGDVGIQTFNTEQELNDYMQTYIPLSFVKVLAAGETERTYDATKESAETWAYLNS